MKSKRIFGRDVTLHLNFEERFLSIVWINIQYESFFLETLWD